METDTVATLISNVGFPIFCVLALGFFVYKAYIRISDENRQREEKLYTMLGKNQEQLDRLEDVNSQFVEVLNAFKSDNQVIKKDIEDIKETVKRLPKRKTDKEDINGRDS